MLVPITEQVYIPIHRIERISFFGTTATVKYVDSREVDRIENEDAQRLMKFVTSVTAKACQTDCPCSSERKKR